jgi:hypothetical protein
MSESGEEARSNTDPNLEAWRGAIADALWYFAGEGARSYISVSCSLPQPLVVKAIEHAGGHLGVREVDRRPARPADHVHILEMNGDSYRLKPSKQRQRRT